MPQAAGHEPLACIGLHWLHWLHWIVTLEQKSRLYFIQLVHPLFSLDTLPCQIGLSRLLSVHHSVEPSSASIGFASGTLRKHSAHLTLPCVCLLTVRIYTWQLPDILNLSFSLDTLFLPSLLSKSSLYTTIYRLFPTNTILYHHKQHILFYRFSRTSRCSGRPCFEP
jgi:hypothetical protein